MTKEAQIKIDILLESTITNLMKKNFNRQKVLDDAVNQSSKLGKLTKEDYQKLKKNKRTKIEESSKIVPVLLGSAAGHIAGRLAGLAADDNLGNLYLDTIGEHILKNDYPDQMGALSANVGDSDVITPDEAEFMTQLFSKNPEFAAKLVQQGELSDKIIDKTPAIGGILGTALGTYGGFKYAKKKENKS